MPAAHRTALLIRWLAPETSEKALDLDPEALLELMEKWLEVVELAFKQAPICQG